MALIKEFFTEDGNSGTYWRLLELNDHKDRGSVATLQLYKSKSLRESEIRPMGKSLQFVFTNEENSSPIFENSHTTSREEWYAYHYILIKNIMKSGESKNPEDRSQNEKIAECIYGAVDDI